MATFKIDRRSKQAKIFYEYIKTLPFIEIINVKEESLQKPVMPKKTTKRQLIEEMSKKVNKAAAKKWYEKSGIKY